MPKSFSLFFGGGVYYFFARKGTFSVKKKRKERDLRDQSEWDSADRVDWHPLHHTRIIATIRSGFYSNSLKILVAMQIILSFSARLVWDWQVNNGLCWDYKQFTIGQDDNSILDLVNTNPKIHYIFRYKQKFWDFQRTPDDNSVCGRGQFLQKRSTQDLICFSCKLGRTHCAQRRGWTQMYWTTVVTMQSVSRQSNSSTNTFSLQNSILNFYWVLYPHPTSDQRLRDV